MKLNDIVGFGNLEGLTVLCMGNTIAAPFAAELMAENGARVIYIENPNNPDIGRMSKCPYGFMAEHRNELCISLDLKTEAGREAFLRAAEKADIIIEGLKGGTFASLALDDETLWGKNKKLVIIHVSGYGETGLNEYINRASYDPIGQAAGGYMAITGFPEPGPPLRVPFICDYFSALFACWSALAALHGVSRSGEGESIDVSQIEVMWKLQFGYPLEYFHSGVVHPRQGNEERDYVCFGTYLCGDGKYVFICCIANGPARGLLKTLRMENDPTYPETIALFPRGDVAAERVNAELMQYCLKHTAAQVEKELCGNGVPCSMIHDISTIQDHPQILARELFIEWEDKRFGTLKGINVVPKMKRRPGQFWGAAHDHGEDNRDVLLELGYSEAEIEKLYNSGVVNECKYGGYFASRTIQCRKND